MNSNLLHSLVAGAGSLRPVAPQGGLVNLPPQLPPILRFGGNERGPLQSQQFTGATVPHPLNMVSGGDIQPFTPPVYAPPSGGSAPVHPVVAALAAALTGIHPPVPAPVGAPPPPAVHAHAPAGPVVPGGPYGISAPSNGSVPHPVIPVNNNAAQDQAARTQSALIAALALGGQKFNPGLSLHKFE